MILQMGVKPSWFNTSRTMDAVHYNIPGTPSATDLRSYMINSPQVGDSAVPEMLLKVLEPYRIEGGSSLTRLYVLENVMILALLTCITTFNLQGCILDDEKARLYASLAQKGSAVRFAFAAAIFGDIMEALFWLQLPNALNHFINKLVNKPPKVKESEATKQIDEVSMLNRISSRGQSLPGEGENSLLVSYFIVEKKGISIGYLSRSYYLVMLIAKMVLSWQTNGQLRLMAFDQEELWRSASERIPWHEKLEGDEAIQNRVHE